MNREERLAKAVEALIEQAVDSVEYSDWPELQEAVEEGREALSYCHKPKIVAVQEKVRQVAQDVAEHEATRKVIVLRTKEVFVAPDEAAQEPTTTPDEPFVRQVDQDVVEALEDALEQAKKGGVQGAIILMGLPTLSDDDVVTDVSMISTGAVMDNIQIFVGGLETAKADLLGAHSDIFYGPEDDDE